MVIFPEGTRSNAQEMSQEFKPGALKPAYLAYAPILPVAIVNSYQIFDKKNKGKKIVHVIFNEPLEPQDFIHISSNAIAAKCQKLIQESIDRVKNQNKKQKKKI